MSAHVIPCGDLVEHDLDAECICGPDIDADGDGNLWIHHSLDGREKDETDE